MLQPNSRRLLFDALAPPAGYKLDFTVGTSYTLDLISLLATPVAFAFSDWQDQEGRPTPDPLALLKAVRQYADRMCLFCQAGKIYVPPAFQPLLVSLESSVIEALAPRGGSFHPKVWFLRFRSNEEPSDVMYRFLCLSRNMTFDRAWDTMLCLDGTLTSRTNAFSQNHPLGQFAESLPAMSVRKLSKEWKKRFDMLAYEIRRVEFDLPDGIDEIAYWPIGIDTNASPDDDWPFDSSKRSLVISPFVSGGLLNDLADISDQVELISRADQLETIGLGTLERFSDVWILDESAELEPSELEQAASSPVTDSEPAAADSAPLVGLHAKLYVFDEGWDASIFTGSANATHAAFHQNVEFLAQIRGKKSKIGVEAILGESKDNAEGKTAGAACLMDMLQPFKPAESAEEEDEAEKRFERYVDELARQIAFAQPSAFCSADRNGFRVDLKPNHQQKRKHKVSIDSEYVVSVRPASQPTAAPTNVDLGEDAWATFPSLAMLSLTSFFVFSVSTEQPKKMTREFVLNLPLAGEPEGRKEALLRHLLSDKDRVLRFMMLLLSDADASAFAEFAAGNEGDGESFQLASMLDGRTLFESMMQCAWKDPSRLQQIANMIADLQGSDEGQELIPDDFNAIWDPIWAVAEQEIEKSSKRRKR